jgi:hypothetical protein
MLRAQVPLAHRVVVVLSHHPTPRRTSRAIKRLFNLSDRTQAVVKDYGFSDCNFM